MKKRACFSFRPRPGDPEQQRAWEILQAVPEGKKTAFVAGAILRSREEEALEQTLRRVLREELQASPVQRESGQEDPIPQEMLRFLDSLS